MDESQSSVSTKPSDAGLSLLWPGLAQVEQGRTLAGACFAIEAALACAVFLWAPEARPAMALAGAALVAWSMADARAFERRDRVTAR